MNTRRICCGTSRGSSLGWLRTCLEYDFPPVAGAYVVPWVGMREVDLEGQTAGTEPVRVFQNRSPDVLLQVRAWRACRCGLRMSLPRRVLPGDLFTVEWATCHNLACREGQWWLRWFAPGGKELMWPFVW